MVQMCRKEFNVFSLRQVNYLCYVYTGNDVTSWMVESRANAPLPGGTRRKRQAEDDTVDTESAAYAAISPDIYDTSRTVGDVSPHVM